MSIFAHSKIAGNNTTVEGINCAENSMAGADVNNFIRAYVAAVKKWQEDMGGALTSGGSANAQTLTTNSVLTAFVDGIELGFVAGFTNTGPATLNVDTLGAKVIRKIANDGVGDQGLGSSDIQLNGHYTVRYDASANSAAGAWILLNPSVPFAIQFAYDELDAIGGAGSAADRLFYYTGAGTGALLTFTAAGRALASAANAGAQLTALGVSAFLQTVLDDADAATARTTLGAQALDAELTALADLTSAADKLPYFTGSGTASLADFSSVARTLTAQTTQALMRTTGLGLGTAATQNTGTSGANVPLLNAANTASAQWNFTSDIGVADNIRLGGTEARVTAGEVYYVQASNAAAPTLQFVASSGNVEMSLGPTGAGGLLMKGATGGLKGDGTINATIVYENDQRVYTNRLNGSATYNPPSLGSGLSTITTVTVTGAALGDYAIASFSPSTSTIALTAMVTAANTVTVSFHNVGGSTVDLASGTLRAVVFPQ